MSTRDERGNYVNEQGVTIKVSEYKNGVKIDFYDKNPAEKDHRSIHTRLIGLLHVEFSNLKKESKVWIILI